MDAAAFVAELDRLIGEALNRIRSSASADPPTLPPVEALLLVALKNELEAAEEAALWMDGESDIEVKLALARQCGDEAKHYRLIQERLRQLGSTEVSLAKEGYSSMYRHLASLKTTVERVAAGPFAREALAQVRNQAFIEYCEAKGDKDTASLYRDVIQPDEAYHHQLGRTLLTRLARSQEQQAAARSAAMRTLALAEELQEAVRLEKGLTRLPGC
jgi:hypothetical protein